MYNYGKSEFITDNKCSETFMHLVRFTLKIIALFPGYQQYNREKGDPSTHKGFIYGTSTGAEVQFHFQKVEPHSLISQLIIIKNI